MHFVKYLMVGVLLLLPMIVAAQDTAPDMQQSDVGLQYVVDSGLTETLNDSETEGDFTVTVEQAYADANRIAIWYNITMTENVTIPLSGTFINTSLWTPEGEWFGTGGQGGGSSLDADGTLRGYIQFNHQQDLPDDGTYEATLRFEVAMPELNEDGTLAPAMPPASPDEYDATLEFGLSLSGYDAVVLEPQLTSESDDIEITLESLRVTPSQTNLELCFELPDEGDWQPNVQLQLGELLATMSGFGFANGQLPSPEDTSRCSVFHFYVPYDNSQPQDIVISIDRLQTSVPEYNEEMLERATERLAEQGITVEFELAERGLSYDVTESPEGTTESQVGQMVFDAMREYYEGDWTFELTLEPQA